MRFCHIAKTHANVGDIDLCRTHSITHPFAFVNIWICEKNSTARQAPSVSLTADSSLPEGALERRCYLLKHLIRLFAYGENPPFPQGEGLISLYRRKNAAIHLDSGFWLRL